MVRFWNARVHREHRVPAPTSSDDLSVATYNLPGIAGGMWHAYSTRAHDVALDSPIINQIFTEMTGTPNWQVHPNRLRFNPVNADDGWKAAHLEGESLRTRVGSIVCEKKKKISRKDVYVLRGIKQLGRCSCFVQRAGWTKQQVCQSNAGAASSMASCHYSNDKTRTNYFVCWQRHSRDHV